MLLIIHIYHNKRLVYALKHSHLPQQDAVSAIFFTVLNIVLSLLRKIKNKDGAFIPQFSGALCKWNFLQLLERWEDISEFG